MDQLELDRIGNEIETELRGHILPFWLGLRDERGGFYGEMTPDLVLHQDARKGVMLHAGILWAFSAAYRKYQEPAYLSAAAHAYTFLRKAWDIERGGFYRSLNADGTPAETEKYAVCHALCIYGLAVYAEASGDQDARKQAVETFDCIETHFASKNGYSEAFTADWQPIESDEIPEKDLHAAKTMRTMLHLIEAYAELYRLTGEKVVGTALKKLIKLMADRIYQPDKTKFGVYYDDDLNELGDFRSFGYDIEASWLLDHACECLGDKALTAKLRKISCQLADHVSREAFFDGALFKERFADTLCRTRVWWVQAEGVVGCLNAAKNAKLNGDDGNADRLMNLAVSLWHYLQSYQIDRREGGEWHAETDQTGIPLYSADMAGPWKSPYHTCRMCLEFLDRTRQRTI